MEAFYILNSTTSEILISKIFESISKDILTQFRNLVINRKLNPIEGFVVCIMEYNLFYKEIDGLFYVIAFKNNCHNLLLTSCLRIIDNIHTAIKNSFDINTENILNNRVDILLMIDSYIIKGIPVYEDNSILYSLIYPSDFTDDISEKIIGKAKTYDCKDLLNYIKSSQEYYGYSYCNNTSYKLKEGEKILFDFIDKISNCVIDNEFRILEYNCCSVLKISNNVGSKVDIGVSLNIPYKVDSASYSKEIKTNKEDILKYQYFSAVPKFGESDLVRLKPNKSTKLLFPFKINVKSNLLNIVRSVYKL